MKGRDWSESDGVAQTYVITGSDAPLIYRERIGRNCGSPRNHRQGATSSVVASRRKANKAARKARAKNRRG